MNFQASCGTNLVTWPPRLGGGEAFAVHRVGAAAGHGAPKTASSTGQSVRASAWCEWDPTSVRTGSWTDPPRAPQNMCGPVVVIRGQV